ncbi:MAG: tripartite tricarboxylate transporter permease [Pygmaiobacter massiliensis]|nr:tripartite tricarboxylate transporter permease [Pygmaiobacter massiliensis]
MVEFLSAFQTLLQPTNFLLLFLCSAIGIIIGAIPGMNAGMGIAILLSVTLGMSMETSFAMLLGVWIGGVSGGFIAAVLVGIPGTPSSIATCYDGYPMHKNGQTLKAMGAGIVGSFIGTFLSILIAAALCPLIAELAVKLGPWEYFSLCLCAIFLISSFSRENMFKGFAGAFIGMLLAAVGAAPIDATPRFTFGNYHLLGGLDIVALILGFFAIKEILTDTSREHQVAPIVKTRGALDFGITWRDLKDNFSNIVRSFLIGLWIGFLPGVGSGLSNMVAYAQAKNSSKHPEKFGTGIVDGVFASEVSNNASIGGAIIPMVALGIPGDSITAILLSALTIHGLQPGPLFLTSDPTAAYFIFAGVLVAAAVVLVQQLFTMRFFPSILRIPYHYLYSTIIVICFIGAYISTNTIFNVSLMLVFTVFAVFLDMAKISTTPLILGYILGPMLELNFRRGLSYSDQGLLTFVTRPISLILLILAVLSVAWPFIDDYLKARKSASADRG